MKIQIISIMIILGIIILAYMLIKLNETIRKEAYKLFLKAEHKGASGIYKMSYVVSNIYSILPNIVQFFISRDTLEKIVQKMFDEIKDLLDDGKRNKSTKGGK